MKSFIAIVFVMLYGFALIRPALPLLDYYVAMEKYKAHCINKERPEIHCNGQCILMQKLKAMNIDRQEPEAPAPVKINLEDYPIGFISAGHHNKAGITGVCIVNASVVNEFLTARYRSDIFHPPLKTAPSPSAVI